MNSKIERKRKREDGDGEADGDGDAGNEAGNDGNEGDEASILQTETVAAKEEEALLENALDAIQQDTGEGTRKTREEAELDRQKLLAGELLVEGGGNGEDDGEDDDNGMEFRRTDGAQTNVMSIAEREAEILRRSGYSVVSEDETMVAGDDLVLPWRKHAASAVSSQSISTKKEDTDGGSKKQKSTSMKIEFRTKFDVVDLDEDGFIIDKGDDNFTPSISWTGRRPGFEFKLGERGLGYYRTGAKVVVPSNNAY